MSLPGDAFNNNARGSWRVDLDFEASGGIEGGGGGGGDECGRGNSGGGGNGDEPEDESGNSSITGHHRARGGALPGDDERLEQPPLEPPHNEREFACSQPRIVIDPLNYPTCLVATSLQPVASCNRVGKKQS